MTLTRAKTVCVFLSFLFALSVRAEVPAFDNDKLASTFITDYSQSFNTTWDGFSFNNQWDMLTTFTANDCQLGYLKFTATKRNIRSKLPYQAPYIITADIDYADGSNLGGVVVRGEQASAVNALSNPLGSVFCRDGIAFFPTADGANMTVHFTGVLAGATTTYTDILVPKPADVTSLMSRGTIRIEDYETSIYVYYNGKRFMRINFGAKTGSYYSSGEVFDADMVSKGTFTNMEVIDNGRVAVVKNEVGTEAFRLYSVDIQKVPSTPTAFENGKPVVNFTTDYSEMYNTTWDNTKFYNQWDMIDPNTPFAASTITSDFLQFEWPARRVIRSKATYPQPYIFETDVDYTYTTDNGGMVLRAKADGNLDDLQTPADYPSVMFNRAGIALYPYFDGSKWTIQFNGTVADPTTPFAKFFVPKPSTINSFIKRGVVRVEDYGTSIFVYYDGAPLAKINLSNKVGNIYTSGEVFDASMVSVGTFTNMSVEAVGKISFAQRLANSRLYSARVKVAPFEAFNDTFDDGTLTGWTTLSGTWTNPGTTAQGVSDGNGQIIKDNIVASDFIYEADLKLITGYSATVLTFRGNNDGSNSYLIGLDGGAGQVKFYTFPYAVLATVPYSFLPDTWYHLKVVAYGTSIKIYLNYGSDPIIDMVDATYSKGRLGLTVWAGTVMFDNVKAEPLVYTVPASPTSIVATAGDGSASIEFTAPVTDGGSSITSYTVTSNPGNISVSGSSSPLVVTGLTNGTTYTFTVTATNGIGTSLVSVPSNQVTPSIPSSTKEINSSFSIYQTDKSIVFDLSKVTGNQIISIFDLQGRNVKTFNAVGGQKFSISNTLNSGIYFAKIQGSEKTVNAKIIIK